MKSYAKNIISLKAFLGKTNLSLIDLIKFCKLKHTGHWSQWIDDYGNELKITDNKDISIILNINCDTQNINSKDLYIKKHISDIFNQSKLALISIFDDSYYIWLLDNNDILRLYYYVDDIYIGIQPILSSSADTLKKIIRNLHVENFQELFHITKPSSRKEADKTWITKLPMDEKLFKMLPETLQKDMNINAEG